MSPRTSPTRSAVAAASSLSSSPCTSSAPRLPRLARPSSESPAKGVTPEVSGQSKHNSRMTLTKSTTPFARGDDSGRVEVVVAGTIAVPRSARPRPVPAGTESRGTVLFGAIGTTSNSRCWPQQAPVPDWSQRQRAGSRDGAHPSATDRRVIAGVGSDGDPRRGDDDRVARGIGPGARRWSVEANTADDRASASHRLRAAFALIVVALLAACAEPSQDNVSPIGPTTTVGETTTDQHVEVGRWSGSTSTDTENITVEESWELHWKITGEGIVSVQWLEPGDVLPDGMRTLDEPAGSSLIREGGTFYLSIGVYGPSFEVWAVDVPN